MACQKAILSVQSTLTRIEVMGKAANDRNGSTPASLHAALRPTVFDRDVLALDVAGFGKAPDESQNLAGGLVEPPLR
jgi:hypothetical protein